MPWADQVDAGPVREHVRMLMSEGMSISQIQFASGINRTAIRVMLGDFPGRKASKQVRADTAACLLRVRPNRGVSIDGMVPVVGTLRRLHALVAIGYPKRDLAIRLGATSPAFQGGRSGEIRAVTAQAVMELYDELQHTQGPSSRAREGARGRGWLPPAWWDDDAIDDPLFEPDGIREYVGELLLDDVTLPRAVRVDLMTRRGLTPGEIAQRLGSLRRYVHRDLLEADRG